MNKKIVLIDGHSILNRAFYGLPELTNSKGIHTNAVYGFLNILFKLLDEEQAEYLTVAFDVHQPTFRHKMFQEYKGTRKPMPEELREQVPLIKEVLQTMNIHMIEKPGFEADDVLGTLARKWEGEGLEVSLVSGDRDLLQLASEHVKIRIPKTKRTGTEIEDYHTEDVVERYGIEPYQVIEMKALMGDTADNIPGVPGIGEKTALKILQSFQTLENAYEHLEEIKPNRAKEALRNHYELAKISKILATIKTDCPIECELEESKISDLFNQNSYKQLKDLEFKSLLRRFDSETVVSTGEENEFQCIKKLEDAEGIFKELRSFSDDKDFTAGFQILSVPYDLAHSDKKNHFIASEDGQFSFLNSEDSKSCSEKLFGMAVCYENGRQLKNCFISTEDDISSDYLFQQFEKTKLKGTLSVLDLKEILYQLPEYPEKNGMEDGYFDCKVAAYLLNPLKDTYYYDDLARDYLGMTVPSYEDFFGKATLEKAWEKREDFIKYACYEAMISYKVFPVLKKELEKTGMAWLYNEVELPLVITLFDMEKRGIHVNKEALEEYGEQLSEKIVQLEKEIYDLTGETFNINSPKQLGQILFEKMKLPFAKKTKTGYSTSADILEKLRCEHPVIDLILIYRQMAKLKSTYADGLTVYIKEDGRIHGKFNQTITATGRISSTEPNLQNIPIRMEMGREIRKVFVPEDGFLFVDADYSQIELRVLAHMSGDERLIEAFEHGQDIHRITASQVFHTPFEEVTPLQRRNAKAVNFGIVYGISSFGLSQDLNISRKEADSYIKKYFETYPRVKEFLDELVSQAKEKGYVETMFHRIRPVPELKSSNFMQRNFGERIAMNSPIQGTAADIIKIAMVRVNEKLKEKKMHSRLVLQIHDELLVETQEGEKETVIEILQEEMSHAAELSIKLETDVNYGKNWLEAH